VHLLVAHLIGLPKIVGDDYVAGAWSGSVAEGWVDCGFNSHPVLRFCMFRIYVSVEIAVPLRDEISASSLILF
jgi:hypothetical protein